MRLRAVLKERSSMRFEHYLTENVDDIIGIINDKCQPFVKKFRNKTMGLFYRGVKKNIPEFDVVSSRLDNRKPLDSSNQVHEIANKLFIKKFGWPVRNGVFASSDEAGIMEYGSAYIFFPMGDFDYVWSHMVSDFYTVINDADTVSMYLNTYDQNMGLPQAWLDGCEISFKCDEYLLINIKYQETLLKWWRKKYEI
jgi:hypothetical protein